MTVVEILVKTVFGGTLVVTFAVLAEMLAPKRFAGILAAAPSVALASMLVSDLFKGPHDVRRSGVGMLAGAVGFTLYCIVAPWTLKRLGTLAGSAVALLAWAAGAAALWPAVSGMSAAKAGAAGVATAVHGRRSRPRLQVKPGKAREAKPKELATRFAFGAGTSAVAGVLSVWKGPVFGGLFMAFPAILLASLTLIADEEGQAAARDDARGATAGTIGLIAFAFTATRTFGRIPTIGAFALALLAWLLASAACYAIAWLAGVGGDEKPQAG